MSYVIKPVSDHVVSLEQDEDGVHLVIGDLYLITLSQDGTLLLWSGCEGNEVGIKVDKTGHPVIKRL